MAYERTQLMVPAVASATAVHAAVTLTSSTQTVTTGITDPACYRAVSVKGNQAGVTGNVTVTGTDWNGATITDTIALSGASTVAGVRAFKTVTSIALPALVGAGDTVSVGIADVFGLYGSVTAEADVMLQERAASGATEFTIEATGTVNTTYDTVATAIVSGDRIRWTYLDSGTTAASSVLFTVAQARAWDKAQLATAATYSDATIEAAEVAIRAEFERIIGVALVTTSTEEVHDGDGQDELWLRHHNPYSESNPRAVVVTACVITDDDGTTDETFDSDDISDLACYPSGKIIRRTNGTFLKGQRNVTVTYTHGFSSVPADIRDAALAECVHRLVPSPAPRGAEGGSEHGIDWSQRKDPSRQRWYGLHEVDGVLAQYRQREHIPAMA